MPTYKGNVGNLMQHWTLCELLSIAHRQGVPGLNFIDAHAMAPLARAEDLGSRFKERFTTVATHVQQALDPDHQWSTYEWAWHHLAPSVGYPNSAAFVEKIWRRKFALSLCEIDWPTIEELKLWRDRVSSLDLCTNAEILCGDWRDWFPLILLNPTDVGLLPKSLTLVSFDPYMYFPGRNFGDPGDVCGGNLYPDDIVRLLDAIGNGDMAGPVIIQFSTYSDGYGSAPHGAVLPQIDVALTAEGFAHGTVVTVPLARGTGEHQDMMSMVYSRGVGDDWLGQLQGLPHRFAKWVRDIPPRHG